MNVDIQYRTTVHEVEFAIIDAEPVTHGSDGAMVLPVRGKVVYYTDHHVDGDGASVEVIVSAAPLTKAGKPHAGRNRVILTNDEYEAKIRGEVEALLG